MRLVLLLGILTLCPAVWGAEVWVAPNGSDEGPGTREKPFATLVRARDAVRAMKAAGALPHDGVTITLRAGTYAMREGLALDAQDSGTAEAPVVYAAAPGEKVVLSGAAALQREWVVPVRDPAVLGRVISEEARAKLLQCDLKAHGITDYGELSRHGFYRASERQAPPPMALYVNGERMMLARWPNPDDSLDEFLSPPQKGRRGAVGRAGIVDKGPKGGDPDFWDRGGTFTYAFDRPARWTQADDIWLDGVFAWSWEWSYNKLATIDPQKKEITLRYGEVSGIADQYSRDFFFAENLLEEIDVPGEYFIDRKSGILYLLPPVSFTQGATMPTAITVTALRSPLFTLKDASHVVLRDLVMEGGRGSAVTCTGGEGVRIQQCEIRDFAGSGVSLQGRNHGVARCHIHHLGGVGVGLAGGNPETLEPSGCFVENSHIHHVAWYQKVYTPAVALGYRSVGSRISHNLIHDTPHLAVVLYGNDHRIEYNELRNVVTTYTDMGAIYANLGACPRERGTVIRRNYFHDIGQARHLQNAVYPDNGTMGITIEENVFARIGSTGEASNCRAIDNNSGSYILTRNNVFVDCTIPYMMNLYTANNGYGPMSKAWETSLPRADLARLPHAGKYPELLRFWDEPRQYPESNTWERNLIYNPNVPVLPRLGKAVPKEGAFGERAMLRARDNWVADVDPGFVDAAKGDFTLRPDAPAFARIPGFRAIPFREIGPTGGVGPFGGTRAE